MKIKKLISLLLAIIMMFSVLTISTTGVLAFDSTGSCGDNVTYEFNATTGTLTISGTGEMYNYKDEREMPILPMNTAKMTTLSETRSPWNSSTAVKRVIVNDGVTSLGSFAFYKCTKLEVVIVNSSVTTIANGALDECEALKDFCYTGSESDYGSVTVGKNNAPLKNARMVYNYTAATCPHRWKLSSTTAATCTTDGAKNYVCKICDDTKSTKLTKLGHDWDKGTITKQPTFTSKGKRTRKCTRCSASKVEDIAMLGKPSITKLTKGTKSIKVTWKKVSNIGGYQIQYSTSKTFKSNNTKVKIKGANNSIRTLKNLKSKKTYYVRIRAYKTINGKTKYSAWSAKKYTKTK